MRRAAAPLAARDPAELTLADAVDLLAERAARGPAKKKTKKKATKKKAIKKKTAKKTVKKKAAKKTTNSVGTAVADGPPAG